MVGLRILYPDSMPDRPDPIMKSKNVSHHSSFPFHRIVVADDHVDVASSLGLLLSTWGQEVRVAYSGEEALRAAEAFLPHLVFLDLDMPDIDGFEVARRIRQTRLGRDVVLIALTGWEYDRYARQEAGFNFHRRQNAAEPAHRFQVCRVSGLTPWRKNRKAGGRPRGA